jgi:hypothetical protein
LLDVHIVGARQIRSAGHFEREIGVVESRQNVRDDGLLVDADAEHLSFLVDSNDPVRRLMFRGDEDRLTGYPVHVYASGSFKVIQMNEAIFGDKENDTMLLRYLHGHREVVGSFWGEVDVDCFLGERRVGGVVVNLYDMKLNGMVKQVSPKVKHQRTFAPVEVRTAKEKSLVVCARPSSFISANAAA